MKKSFLTVLALTALFIQARHWTTAYAASGNLYGHTYGTSGIAKFDSGTFTISDTFTNLTGTDGRGVVVVAGTIYYTDAGSGSVYTYNSATHTNNGVLFTVAGASGLSTAAFDGTNLWLGDYSGTNHAFQYSLTGTLLKTVSLSMCGSFCDGLEYFVQSGQGRLISNRGDQVPPYDIYDTNGTLLTSAFIAGSSNCASNGETTGIAWDGANFYVSNINNGGKICVYNGTTGAFISVNALAGTAATSFHGIEDLSADYAVTLGPPMPTTPGPATFGLVICGLLLLFMASKMLRDKFASAA